MKTIMDDSRLTDFNEIAEFLKSSKRLVIKLKSIEDKYLFVNDTVDRFHYHRLNRHQKRIILAYAKKLTGYKKAQLMRLISRAVIGDLVKKKYIRNNSFRIYSNSDIKLLEKTDELHKRLNSLATKEILRREFFVYGHSDYQTISQVSRSHINNLRKHQIYRSHWVNGTKAKEVPIGETQPPEVNDMPGSIRVDTVHQRDVYHLNFIDEITQWELAACVPVISERFLLPVLELLLDQFPFVVFNFHSDRGSEFINEIVAKLLNKLLINQTKSRSRHCNDNALVEGKNGSVIRKNMGYCHIDKGLADSVNLYYKNYFNIYLNFHRPCLFLTETRLDRHKRERRIYGYAATPYRRLKELSQEKQINFLKEKQSFKKLDIIEMKYSDNEFAEIMRNEERKLFNSVIN